MPSAFETDTAVQRMSAGCYEANVADRWHVGPVPNGGYLLAIVVRALAQELPHPDPFAVSAHFLRPAQPGRALVEVEAVRTGRALSTGMGRLLQGEREHLRVLAAFGDFATLTGPTRVTGTPPALPPPEECVRGRAQAAGGVVVEMARRFDTRWPPGTPGWAHGGPSGVAEEALWLRFADEHPVDTLALVQIADALPPPVMELGVLGWVPTIELTVHVRARPAPGWLRCVARTRFLQEGYLEEDVEVWDTRDMLVAQSRQLARLTLQR